MSWVVVVQGGGVVAFRRFVIFGAVNDGDFDGTQVEEDERGVHKLICNCDAKY